jgi:multidrug efflux pump subunit AcrB
VLVGAPSAVQGGAGGFVPAQDKQYLIGFAQLPDGATLDRTEDVIRRMSEIALKHPASSAMSPSRPVDQRLHQQLQRRHRVRHAQALRPSARRRRPERRRHRGS